ncbi:hypothetical protein AB840_10130 [Megasphaera cerevisiae DSM 20462]|uniref:Uncharacterized protein n=1 Tax=Megasphaera cerevisiae DSM 20462 TaxID=1122219 RepID=A0A0J6WRK4_9FIRM|nr:hypothetical protein [Megasphaera cerevisiae]KMO86085.1 hypothetical protein AB840_10130 [Megasphaera cerevisiae DSM 20462]SKA02206.1 hypothetical protein SAMN05660900_02157 [Megasphaera cerevisiae DSM 20462]
MFEKWTIKSVKYLNSRIFIKFMDDNDAEYSLKCEETPRPEFGEALRKLRDDFKNFQYNPVMGIPENTRMDIHSVAFKYKDEDLKSFSPECTIRNATGYEGELTISDVLYPTNNKNIDQDIAAIISEANQYIAGHRAQMGLFDGDEGGKIA